MENYFTRLKGREGRKKERKEKRLGKIFLVSCSKKGNGSIKSGIREGPLAENPRASSYLYRLNAHYFSQTGFAEQVSWNFSGDVMARRRTGASLLVKYLPSCTSQHFV